MIADYNSLKAEIANWLARSDLTDTIPTLVQLAEARINRDVWVARRMVRSTETVAVGGFVPLPADFSRMGSLLTAQGGAWRPLDALASDFVHTSNYAPVGYAIVGDQIRMIGTTATEVRLTYWAKVPALSDSQSQNWLLVSEPGLYLHAALIESAPLLKADNRVPIWERQYQLIVDGLNANDGYARYGSAAAQVAPYAP